MKKTGLWKILGCILIILLILLAAAPLAFSRAGGAGGGSTGGGFGGGGYSGGSRGGGDDGAVFYIIYMILQTMIINLGVIPTVIIIGVIIALFAFLGKRSKRHRAVKNMNPRAGTRPVNRTPGYRSFIERNPDFSPQEFLAKARTAFIEIQKAWSEQDLSGVRRFVSDGVYRRFHTQFVMMSLLKQENPLSDITVHTASIDRFETDGDFDIIHVLINASMKDQFICKTNPRLDSPGGYESFQEYWSFIRKRGVEGKDIYSSNACPNCSAPLPKDMGEIGKCGYCGAMVNSGEFDWVLSEITQVDDYARSRALTKSENLSAKVRYLIEEYEDFSVQLVEDKASNAVLQIRTSEVMKDTSIMRRFVSERAFEKLKARIPEERIVYNRIYLNDVTLVAAKRERDKNVLSFSITFSYQRVKLTDNDRAEIIDPVIKTHTEVLQMSRDAASKHNKGSLYPHTCPACGASVQDSLDVACAYCGTPLNSTAGEWIVTDVLSLAEFDKYLKASNRELKGKISPAELDGLYEIKDYALNNIMILVSVDGEFSEEERRFSEQVARRWGYSPDKLEPLFDMARAGRLSIRMPEDMQKRRKIYDLLKKAAESDSRVTSEENLVLRYVEETYLN